MIKLHGFAISNYFNMVKMALIEKGIDYEVVEAKPSQDADFLAISPMGKVPVLETEQGLISETDVIFDYLEDVGEGPSLMPESAYEKAKVRELIKEVELYIELPARTCFAEAFFGGSVSDETKEKAKANLEKGIACLKRSGKFSPYLAGDSFTYADIMFLYTVGLAGACAKRVLDMDLLGSLPEARVLSDALAKRDSAIQIVADQAAASAG
ncbi:MAG: glutathione S-transferase family protein [Pseudomonadales bacterium]|nr:glutathione S-transferase family protein [Pseudomonadales bacterium]